MPPSLLAMWKTSLDAASHPPELEPRPPIIAERKGKATNPTPAMKHTYLHNKIGREKQQPQIFQVDFDDNRTCEIVLNNNSNNKLYFNRHF